MDAVKKVAAAGLFHFGLWRPYFYLRRARENSTAAILTFHRLVDDRDEYLLKGPTVQTHASIFEQVVAVLGPILFHGGAKPVRNVVLMIEPRGPIPRVLYHLSRGQARLRSGLKAKMSAFIGRRAKLRRRASIRIAEEGGGRWRNL